MVASTMGLSSINMSTMGVSVAGESSKRIYWKELFNFDWKVSDDIEKRPYMYLSENLDRLLVQFKNDFSAMIYEHPGTKAGQKRIDWQHKYTMKRYPVMLKGVSSANFLFSPDFEKYIDVDYVANQFVIRNTKSEKIKIRIPAGLISISLKGKNRSETAIAALSTQIMFNTNDSIRIISKEGLDCILELPTLRIKSFA